MRKTNALDEKKGVRKSAFLHQEGFVEKGHMTSALENREDFRR